MKSGQAARLAALVYGCTALGASAGTLGVYLPSQGARAQQEELARSAAAALSESLQEKLEPTVFASYPDFARACAQGQLAAALAEGWAAAAQHGMTPSALASSKGRTEVKWKLVSKQSTELAQLVGGRVALPIPEELAPRFLEDVLLQHAVPGRRALEPVSTPDAATALKLLESGQVRAALIPADILPPGFHEVFESPALPRVALLLGGEGKAKEAPRKVKGIADFDGFSPRLGRLSELAEQLSGRANSVRKPALAEPKSYNLRLNQWLRPPAPLPSPDLLMGALEVHEEI